MRKFWERSLKIGLPVLIIILMMVWLGGTFRRGMVHPGKVTAAQTSAAGTPLYTVTAVTAPLITEEVGAVQPQVRSTVSARVKAMQEAVVEAQEVLKNEQTKYEVGRTFINFVLEAEAGVLSNQSLLAQAQRSEVIASLSLELATGRINVDSPALQQ